MIEDKILILRFRCGSSDALRRIYEKYRDYLLRVAAGLLQDVNMAEDTVHDVFLRFAQSGDTIKVKGSLKSYLRTCVVNRAYNKMKSTRVRSSVDVDVVNSRAGVPEKPDHWITFKEQSRCIHKALTQIPVEQREVVVLRLFGNMKFKEIADFQTVSLKTAQSRYRYGLKKLKLQLNGELEK